MSEITVTTTAITLYDMFVKTMVDLQETSRIYVKEIESNPGIKQELIELGLPSGFLATAERIGRGQLHYKLMYKTGFQFARLRFLPFSEQERALDGGPIEVLLPGGDKLKVSIDNMTREQAAQVFSPSGIRDIAAQRAFLESRKIHKTTTIELPKNKYHVSRGTLVVGDVVFTKAELVKILGELL